MTKDAFHYLALGKGFHCGRQIGIGFGIATDEPSGQRHDNVGVEPEKLFHGKVGRIGQLHHKQMAARLEHTPHFLQTLVQLGKVADTIGCRYGIESGVGVGEVKAVLAFERDAVLQPNLLDFLAAYLHHAFRNVRAYKLCGFERLCRHDGKVAGTSGNVQHKLWGKGFQRVDGLLPPSAVNAKGKRMVEKIISGGNVVKHCLHLFFLFSLL